MFGAVSTSPKSFLLNTTKYYPIPTLDYYSPIHPLPVVIFASTYRLPST